MLEGVTTMDEAETLRGLEFRVPADALHPLDGRTHYVHDLAGAWWSRWRARRSGA